ncbi:MAG: hypothetical protein JEZ02_20860, partial [Desulfatibacillum sp.]|nr:hypothetical protein [Desulfatibacillum sp.]
NAENNYLHVQAKDSTGQLAGEILHIGPWLVDAVPPVNPVLTSTSVVTDTCTNENGATLLWTPGSDACGDVTYAWVLDSNPVSNPVGNDPDTDTEPPDNILFTGNVNYLHLVAIDEAGNAADEILHFGPWTLCHAITGPELNNWNLDPFGLSFDLEDETGVNPSSIQVLLETSSSAQTDITSLLNISYDMDTTVTVSYAPALPWAADTVITATIQAQDTLGNFTNPSPLVAEDSVRAASTHEVYAGESIQDALDAATSGDTVHLNPGLHVLAGSPLNIGQRHNGITLLGDGIEDSLVRCDGVSIVVNNVSGFTMQGLSVGTTQNIELLYILGNSDNVAIDGNAFAVDHSERTALIYFGAAGVGNRIVNNIMTSADNAGTGVYVDGASPEIVNNTMTDLINGIDCVSSASPLIAYNIIAFNSEGIYADNYIDVYYNCVFGNGANYDSTITHNTDINNDPLFVDAEAGDYHLLDSSPLVDSLKPSASDISSIAFPENDLDNNSRPLGGNYDPGCYETLATLAFTSTPADQVNENAAYSYTPEVTGAIVSFSFDAASQLPTGMTISNTTGEIDYNPQHDDEAGTYTIIVVAHAVDGRTVSQTFTVTVTAVNDPPEVPVSVEPQPYAAMVNRLFSLEFYSYDEETAVLEYSVENGPTGMDIPVPTDGILEWVPQTGTPASVQFSVSAWDGSQDTSTGSLPITVAPSLNLAPFRGSPAILVTNSGAAQPITTTVGITCHVTGGQAPYSVSVLNETVGEITGLDASTGEFTLSPLAAGRTQLSITDALGFTLNSGIFEVHHIEATLLVGGTELNAGDGAVLTVNEPDSDLNGLSFTIPQGSTSSDITPTISQLDSGEPYMAERTSPVVEIGPEGTTFAIPASLAFPNNSAIATDELLVFTYDREQGRWVYVPGAVISGSTVTVPLAHLSLYTLAQPNVLTNQLPGGIAVEDYRLVSFPAYAADMESMVEILSDSNNLDTYDDTKWRLFGFDPQAQWSGDPNNYYIEGSETGFDAQFPFGPCQAYWIISRYAKEVEARGLHVDVANDYYTTLQPGWNLLGNPFTTGLYWTLVESSRDGVTFYRQNSASADNPLKDRNLFYYDPLTRKADPDGYVETTVMQPYAGYWIKNNTGSPLVVKLPTTAFVQAVVGGKGDPGEPGLVSTLTRKLSRMVDRVAWAVTEEDRPPAPPGSGGSNTGTDSDSIGVAEDGGGGGCFVDTARGFGPEEMPKCYLLMVILFCLVATGVSRIKKGT